MHKHTPSSLADIQTIIQGALADNQSLRIEGSASLSDFGEGVEADQILSTSKLSGIVDYEPAELVLTAHTGTQLDEILTLLDNQNQMLAFDPPHLQPHLGTSGRGTLGGLLGTGLSGPRRISAGGVRDYLLGFNGVSGRGDIFKSGSRVMKNVTGYDLSKLMVGSFGTLAVLDEVTLKTLPKPETSQSLIVASTNLAEARAFLRAAFGSSVEPSAGAILPASYLNNLLDDKAQFGAVLRLEGVAESVADRLKTARMLTTLPVTQLGQSQSENLWRHIAEATWLKDKGALWRVSVAPEAGPELVQTLTQKTDCTWLMDWAGGLVWIAGHDADLGEMIRSSLGPDGGHASCLHGAGACHGIPVFQPANSVLADINRRVKEAFDPRHILCPGKMVALREGGEES